MSHGFGIKASIASGLFISYIAVIFFANWSINKWGIVPIGFGLSAPAGVYFAGLAFSIRDGLHESSNKYWVAAAIFVGAILSFLLEGGERIAIASGIAFLFSEFIDFAIYTPLRDKGKMIALFCSNAVGLVVDSALFLYIAFESFKFIEGQIVAKGYMTLIVLAIMVCFRYVKRSNAEK